MRRIGGGPNKNEPSRRENFEGSRVKGEKGIKGQVLEKGTHFLQMGK